MVQVELARRLVEDQFVVRHNPSGVAKRVVMPLSKALTSRLVTAVQALAEAAEMSATELAQEKADRAREAGAGAVALSEAVQRMDSLHNRVLEMERAAVKDRMEVARLRRRMSRVDVGERPDHESHHDDVRQNDELGDDVLDAAGYLEFERRFRGSRESILDRQRDVVGFVRDLIGGDAAVLDLGCGRGEWLEILREESIPAMGVDSNTDMVASAVEHGLDVRHGDLIEYLEAVGEGSLGAVTGFHVAEHLPLPVLRRLLDAAFTALRPGGVVMLETPNPTNLGVGSASFYLDPTHLRPIHPLFFQFLVEHMGFENIEVHGLHPVTPSLVLPDGGETMTAEGRVLQAVSEAVFGAQDYVVVGRRPLEPEA
jgi:SAM-dependent methyltransferase